MRLHMSVRHLLHPLPLLLLHLGMHHVLGMHLGMRELEDLGHWVLLWLGDESAQVRRRVLLLHLKRRDEVLKAIHILLLEVLGLNALYHRDLGHVLLLLGILKVWRLHHRNDTCLGRHLVYYLWGLLLLLVAQHLRVLPWCHLDDRSIWPLKILWLLLTTRWR